MNRNAPKDAPNNARPIFLSHDHKSPTKIPKTIQAAKIPHFSPEVNVESFPIICPIKNALTQNANMAGIINIVILKNLRPKIPQNIPITMPTEAIKYWNLSKNPERKLKSLIQFCPASK